MPSSEGHARAWSARLADELGEPVELSFGRARRNVIVVRRGRRGLEVRLNEHFAEAPEDVRDALAAWLKNGKRARRACARLDEWIDELSERIGPPPARSVRIRPHGEHHDLEEIARDVHEREFVTELPRSIVGRVTWGRRGPRNVRRSMQLGSYEAERNVVRVHPILDQAAVPRWFVRYVVFHELLHASLDEVEERRARRRAGRRTVHHGPEFRRREQAYPDYERVLEWQRRHLGALFRSARSGRPMRVPRRAREAGPAPEPRGFVQRWLFPDVD